MIGFTGRVVAELYEIYRQAATAQPYDACACEAAYDAWKAELLRPARELGERIMSGIVDGIQERAA